MKNIRLRAAVPERDFGQLAALFTLEQDEPTTQPALMADYEAHKARIFRLMVAEDEHGELLGFNWATRSRFQDTDAYFYVIVKPEQRGQGVGRQLVEDIERAAQAAQVQKLEISVSDSFPAYRYFAERCGFTERRHSIGMSLELDTFDDRPYQQTVDQLRAAGFQFTSMEALGNTEEAQRRLYALNDNAAADTPGSEGQHPWLSFEDFQKSVCGSSWYKPAGQMVVIDTASGDWAAMSAITRFEGVDYAYNLFTGTDHRYRGRKLAQAVKVLALRYARDVLKVSTVKTHHNSNNQPMIAIDRKLGYLQTAGNYSMEKILA
jgi:RimJ/RimL family protein N-acetyltransferase